MKIDIKDIQKTVTFGDLDEGDTFIARSPDNNEEDTVYIKTDSYDTAVDLATGIINDFCNSDLVTPISVRLTNNAK